MNSKKFFETSKRKIMKQDGRQNYEEKKRKKNIRENVHDEWFASNSTPEYYKLTLSNDIGVI